MNVNDKREEYMRARLARRDRNEMLALEFSITYLTQAEIDTACDYWPVTCYQSPADLGVGFICYVAGIDEVLGNDGTDEHDNIKWKGLRQIANYCICRGIDWARIDSVCHEIETLEVLS